MNEKHFIISSINSELNINSLKLYRDQLDWYLVSLNKKIIWTNEILLEFQDLLFWESLIEDSNVDWKDVKNLLLAIKNGKFKYLMMNPSIRWSKNEYLYYKNTNAFGQFKIEILKYIIEQNWDWELKEFIEEFNDLYMDIGPYIEIEYDDNHLVEEIKCYGSYSKFKSYIKYLKIIFERHFENFNYSDIAIIEEINNITSLEISNPYNQFYRKYLWEFFSENKKINWTNNLINTFSTSFHWKKLLQNECINWSLESLEPFKNLIEEFKWEDDFGNEEKINAWNGLILNRNLRINLEVLAVSNHTFEWQNLGSNKGFQFSDDFLKYLFGNFSVLISNASTFNHKFFFENLQNNKSYILTHEVLKAYKKLINWEQIFSSNKINFTVKFLNEILDFVDFDLLSSYEKLDWSSEFIKSNNDKFNWEYLKQNKSISWDNELEKIYNSKKQRDLFDDC